MYKKERTLKEEIFILSHLFLVSRYALEQEDESGEAKALSQHIEHQIKEQIKNYSNKDYIRWQNIIAKINHRINIFELIGESKSSHKFVLALYTLLQKIIDSGYNFPKYIADLFQIFLDIEAKQPMEDKDWENIKKSADKRASQLYDRLIKEGLFLTQIK